MKACVDVPNRRRAEPCRSGLCGSRGAPTRPAFVGASPFRRGRRGREARGVGLLDALIALAILAFGLIGMTRMQTGLVRQATESEHRLVAAQLGDELLSTMRVDVDNVDCYRLPAGGVCASAEAKARADDWKARALAALPGAPTATAVLAGDRMLVTLTWTGRAAEDARKLEVTTDVRP
ncbi:MAG: pilus assembly protein PilV [Burkholderiaceae bacterium]